MPETDALRETISSMHRYSTSAPIKLADSAGAFPATLLPFVFPVVIDANALRNDLIRTTGRGDRTVLVSAANSGVLRLFCARHVVDEVWKYLPEWSKKAKLLEEDVARTWASQYLPLLRCVDLPDGLLSGDQAERIRRLSVAGTKDGDPDDVPTATLALLLRAPLLSKDRKALRAVYGPDLDYEAHVQWLDALRSGGDMGPLGQFFVAAGLLAAGIAAGTFKAVVAIIKSVPWPLLVLFGILGGVAFRYLISSEMKGKVAESTRTAAREGWELLQKMLITYAEAKQEFETLVPPAPTWPEMAEAIPPSALLSRACLCHLSRVQRSNQSAGDLHGSLHFIDDLIPHGEDKVRQTLRAGSPFVEVYKGRFQVGAALVRSAAETPGDEMAAPGNISQSPVQP
jgi:predicted nucleic acid-binding protein